MKHAASMDAETLESLMRDYGQEVWNYAYLICRDRAIADDIVQEAFLRAYRHFASFRGEASVKTWLLRITRNLSYNYRSSAFIRRALLLDRIVPGGHHRSAEEAYLDEEATNEVWRRVFRLPAKHREILLLHARHQLSLGEIASLLGIPEGTAKSRLFGARKKLTSLLKEDEGAHEQFI
ncbi:RNA polymerase sigma-70 factor (ECF subfamily) [Cohnella sp. SGD-V74]|uniref:RNA polymerase sigma factor n=1 Tax=unclassified Cohnella TaxID=2636738 RepID=UPI000D4653DA|nr:MULTISPECIES: RNA polymerase sigma factor [unclassified Cohnella]PRX63442.1 RNA polymerase sigma-70 factor (ECF subfamily) [Cohnella sp. SGD-V74]